MFAREVGTIAALDHPNILPVLRVGMINDGRPYLVMKYAARGSLQQFCQPGITAVTPPSMIPTLKHAEIAETPADILSIISAETLDIGETLKDSRRAAPIQQAPADDAAAEAAAPLTIIAPTSEASETSDALESTTREGSPPTADSVPATPEAPADTQQSAQTSSPEATAPEDPARDAREEVVDTLTTENEAEIEAQANASPEIAREDEETSGEAVTEDDEAEKAANDQFPELDTQTEATVRLAAGLQEYTKASEAHCPSAVSQDRGQDSSKSVSILEDGLPGEKEEKTASVLLAEDEHPATTPTKVAPVAEGQVQPLSLHQVLGYLEGAASALYYAHQRGLIHLDVKPANLLLDAEGRLLLADFGVSVLLEGYTHASLHYYVGTPLYTAPEQWLEQPRTASDQYALAVTCYQLLTGRPPFTGNLYAVMHGHLQSQPPAMREYNPSLPTQIEHVLRRALAKEPGERYPDILAFARAFREALEEAANADTDIQMQPRTGFLLKEETPVLPMQSETSESVSEANNQALDKQPGTWRATRARQKKPGSRSARASWSRNLLLLLLALALVAGGGLGFVRSQRPCWLGICAQMVLNTNTITLTNNEIQPIQMTNTGTDTLHWKAQLHPFASWLSLNLTSGTLAPGHTSRLMLRTNVDGLKQNGVYTDTIDITGGPGVATQSIEVTENVARGLSAVSVNTSGQSFFYEENKLQPGKQKITITNRSGHTLNWFTQSTDNNWLSVTPDQGSLKNAQSVDLAATVDNLPNLANDTYQVRFSLVGQLDNQATPTLLQTIDFSLQVNQSPAARVFPTASPASSQAASNQLTFTAQLIQASGAPEVRRANHSMVWNTQDDQLLIFGGSDAQGNLLNDLWSYNPANNQWSNLTPASASPNDCSGSSPSPRENAAMVWDSQDHEVLLYGGRGNDNTYLGDLWAYSPAKNTWSALACSGNGPGARGEAGAVWNGSQMLLLGGRSSSGALADFWSYTPGPQNGWNELAATTPLGARSYPAVAWDSHEQRLYVFGGLGSSNQQLGDFYSYQSSSGWSTIDPPGTAPLARQQALSAWDARDGAFLLMDGWQASTHNTYSTLWSYSLANNAWEQITSFHTNGSSSLIPARMASAMIWDSDDNRAYIYAGSSGENGSVMNDLWAILPG
jgi:serine/threonine protein kinase